TTDLLNFQSWTSGNYSLAGLQFVNWTGDAISLNGYHDADTLTGSSQTDYIHGHGGNDVLIGGAGEDIIYGHDGVDRSGYGALNSTSATWNRNLDGTWTVNAGAQGTDQLHSIEVLQFNDRQVHLDDTTQSFTGDGTSDLLLRNSSGTLSAWDRSARNGRPSPATSTMTAAPTSSGATPRPARCRCGS